MVNHFEFHREITSKSGLLKNLKEICTENGLNLPNVTTSNNIGKWFKFI